MSLNVDTSSWVQVRFGDLVANINDYFSAESDGTLPFVAGPHIAPGRPTVTSYGSTDDDDFPPTFKRKFNIGDVLLHSRGIEKLAAVDRRGVTGEKLFVLRSTDGSRLLQSFLPWLLMSAPAQQHMKENFTGSVNKFLNWGPLADFEFALPPLDEQRRIANLLWAVARHVQAVEAAGIAALRTYEHARLALLSTGPRCEWRSAEIDPERADWVAEVPSDWTAETIASVGRVRSGATPARSQQQRFFDQGSIPWVKTLDLNEGVITSTDETITDQAIAETSAKVFPKGTLMIAMYGGFAQIGRTGRLGVAGATNQAISSIVDLRADVDPVFLHEVLKAGRSKWRKVAASSRKDPNITKTDVERFDFRLPPLDQQAEIIASLAVIQGMVDSNAAEVARLRDLQRSLVAGVFGGN